MTQQPGKVEEHEQHAVRFERIVLPGVGHFPRQENAHAADPLI